MHKQALQHYTAMARDAEEWARTHKPVTADDYAAALDAILMDVDSFSDFLYAKCLGFSSAALPTSGALPDGTPVHVLLQASLRAAAAHDDHRAAGALRLVMLAYIKHMQDRMDEIADEIAGERE